MTSTHYRHIRLPSEGFQGYAFDTPLELRDLCGINIFVGANNSGKSRLLRALYACRSFAYTTTRLDASELHRIAQAAAKTLRENFPTGLVSIGGVESTHFDVDKSFDRHFFSRDQHLGKHLDDKIEQLARITDRSPITTTAGAALNRPGIVAALAKLGQHLKAQRELIAADDLAAAKEPRHYIPILRGMRPFGDAKGNPYRERTVTDYFDSSKVSLPDHNHVSTGLELYGTLKAKLLGEPEDRDAVRAFEQFLSENFFESQPLTLIPREGDNTVHVKIGREKQFPIYLLGDGLQNIIICLFSVFMEPARCLFFMEEPDTSLHPSFQRAFLTALMAIDRHQYFFTTHSNHFLDMTQDFTGVAVYHLTKKSDAAATEFVVRRTRQIDRQVLMDLGVRNSSVLLTNATIWVEGITDRLYLRAYMSKYLDELRAAEDPRFRLFRHYREDLHYSFVEYQGANLTHWTFADEGEHEKISATRLCARAILLADGDIANKGDRAKIYSQMLGNRYHQLQVKEVENLMPEAILRLAAADKFRKFGVDTDAISYNEYATMIGIGSYLDSKLPAGARPLFADDSGTVSQKVRFCQRTVALMNSGAEWHLTPALQALCATIFDHIRSCSG